MLFLAKKTASAKAQRQERNCFPFQGTKKRLVSLYLVKVEGNKV